MTKGAGWKKGANGLGPHTGGCCAMHRLLDSLMRRIVRTGDLKLIVRKKTCTGTVTERPSDRGPYC